jgi:hypothetical protein
MRPFEAANDNKSELMCPNLTTFTEALQSSKMQCMPTNEYPGSAGISEPPDSLTVLPPLLELQLPLS